MFTIPFSRVCEPSDGFVRSNRVVRCELVQESLPDCLDHFREFDIYA